MKFAVVAVLAVLTTGQVTNQSNNCAPRERRVAAIQFARAANTAEAEVSRSSRTYQPLSELQVQPLPDDYKVQLTTDGQSYAFSIKDQTDACHGVVFSDQSGLIYTGAPLQ